MFVICSLFLCAYSRPHRWVEAANEQFQLPSCTTGLCLYRHKGFWFESSALCGLCHRSDSWIRTRFIQFSPASFQLLKNSIKSSPSCSPGQRSHYMSHILSAMLIPHPTAVPFVENGLLKPSACAAIFDVMGKYSSQPQEEK